VIRDTTWELEGLAEQIDRCGREIAAAEAEILTGHADLPGLCMALSDWSAELRILQDEKRRREDTRRHEVNGTTQPLTE
jgi:septal ring factor EnvC (AmiA/AmiB activator)